MSKRRFCNYLNRYYSLIGLKEKPWNCMLEKFNAGGNMKLILAILSAAFLLLLAGCETVPSAGVRGCS